MSDAGILRLCWTQTRALTCGLASAEAIEGGLAPPPPLTASKNPNLEEEKSKHEPSLPRRLDYYSQGPWLSFMILRAVRGGLRKEVPRL